MMDSRYVCFLLVVVGMRGSSYAQTEERVGLSIVAACAKVTINNKDQKVYIDGRMPLLVMINGRRVSSSPSGLYHTLASVKIEEIKRIELQDSSGKLNRFRLTLNFVLKKRIVSAGAAR